MPLYTQYADPNWGECHLWKISEPVDFFIGQLNPLARAAKMDNWKEKRKLEWYAGRYLIARFTGAGLDQVIVDEYGKPHLPGTQSHISLSHSDEWVGLLVHDRPVGIDVQKNRGTLAHIRHKFCRDGDLDLFTPYFTGSWPEYLVWSTKEAVYKAFGRRQLDFVQHILLDIATPESGSLTLDVRIDKESVKLRYRVSINTIRDKVLARAVEVENE